MATSLGIARNELIWPANVKDHTDKDKWINIERNRWAKSFNIPMSEEAPEGFPPNTVNVMRALCALSLTHPQKVSDAFGAMWQAFWVEGQAIVKPEVFGPALVKVLGEKEAKAIMEKASLSLFTLVD
ncbi:hypothetical protein LTR66_002837 [Elasticomyces elasticus]|nr:hypothetical protein LTR28_005480 [Elasticomyces elasticus]KAK4997816.1 hypothetical protein LTR66_002837 [Elasticomyces elasticus]